VQTGPVAVGRTVGAGGGAAEGTTQATAAASAAGENAGAPSGSGGNDRASSSTSAPVPTRSRGTARTSQRKRHAIGAPRAASRSKLGTRALRLTERATTGTLPFTGLDLALFVALGLGLGLAGLRARAFAAR
jgi:hypothetical protein